MTSVKQTLNLDNKQLKGLLYGISKCGYYKREPKYQIYQYARRAFFVYILFPRISETLAGVQKGSLEASAPVHCTTLLHTWRLLKLIVFMK